MSLRLVSNNPVSNSEPPFTSKSQEQSATGGSETSLGNILPSENSALRGRAVDLHRFRALFPDRWGAFLRANHRSAEEVAVFYGVTFRTAENWWHGVCGPSGHAVALAALTRPESFGAIMQKDAA